MSNYNSTNTYVLATHEQAGGNVRMLLAHRCESGRIEYVVGSYFTESTEVATDPWHDAVAFPVAYSWDWGHYFDDVLKATDYWKREVIGSTEFAEAMRIVCSECLCASDADCEFCMVRMTRRAVEDDER